MSSTRNIKKVFKALLLIAVLAFVCDSANAATRYVPSQYESIQAAIDACNNGDVVVVAPGTYTGDGNRDVDFKGKSITVRGKNGPEKCIIDCQGSESDPHRGFYFHSGETSSAVLDGFTIKEGSISRGGGIYCINSSPTITNNIITGNSASGGGIYCDNSSPTITNNMITQNINSGQGGGIWCWDNSHPSITSNVIMWNSARFGGGINCNNNCSPSITNNIIVENSANTQGGGIYCGVSSPDIINNTIIRNWAIWGGGIYSGGDDSFPTVINTILWMDSPQEIYLHAGGSISVTYSNVQGGWAGEGNIHGDPLFRGPAAGDYHLLLDSPCIDAGINTPAGGLPLTDIEGNPRPLDGDGDGVAVADMGAFEAPGPVELLLDLNENIVALNLQRGITNSLTSKLYAAMQVLQDDNEKNDAAAIMSLQAFINTVEAQRGKKIPEADADALIADALQIIKLLSTG